MTEAFLALPAHVRRRLAQALESGLLAPSCSEAALRSAMGLRQGIEDVAASLGELERLGVSGPAAAAWIRALEEAALRTPRPDLVWSGPEVPGVHARGTRRVYEELLGSAERSVWVSTYAYFGRGRHPGPQGPAAGAIGPCLSEWPFQGPATHQGQVGLRAPIQTRHLWFLASFTDSRACPGARSLATPARGNPPNPPFSKGGRRRLASASHSTVARLERRVAWGIEIWGLR